MARTIILAVADETHHYMTQEAVREMYARMVPTSKRNILIPHFKDNRTVGKITEARLIEHENGTFIEIDIDLTDAWVTGLNISYQDAVTRRSLLQKFGE